MRAVAGLIVLCVAVASGCGGGSVAPAVNNGTTTSQTATGDGDSETSTFCTALANYPIWDRGAADVTVAASLESSESTIDELRAKIAADPRVQRTRMVSRDEGADDIERVLGIESLAADVPTLILVTINADADVVSLVADARRFAGVQDASIEVAWPLLNEAGVVELRSLAPEALRADVDALVDLTGPAGHVTDDAGLLRLQQSARSIRTLCGLQ